MPASRSVVGFCLLVLAAGPARAQASAPDVDALKASVLEVLSLASFGMISVPDQGVVVTQDGRDFRMRLPLSGFAAPANAAITAVARPLESGRIDIESMAFPSRGTIETPVANGLANQVEFSIGKQTIAGLVDPSMATESTYTADFGDLRISTARGEQHGEQTIDHFATDGTFSTSSDGRLTFATQSRGSGFHVAGAGPNGFMTDTSARALAGHFSVEGLDRSQGARMLAAVRGLIAAGAEARAQREEVPPGQAAKPHVSAEQRRELSDVVAAADGLLSRIEVDETMEDVQFLVGTAKGSSAGMIGSLRLGLTGDAVEDRLSSRLGVSVDEIALPAMSAETSALIPHHVDLKAVMAGVPVAQLKALLREAAQDHADSALLRTEARSLLADPRARIGIETLAFDAGPLSVTGSAKLLPRADGQLGGAIHIAARGVDALLALVQAQPELQQAMPLIFLAKGMGRTEGDSLVWDIVLGDGAPTINGTPFVSRPARPGRE